MSTTAMWLLLAVVVILILFFSVLYKRRFTVHELALTGVMAALSLVAYLFFRIPFCQLPGMNASRIEGRQAQCAPYRQLIVDNRPAVRSLLRLVSMNIQNMTCIFLHLSHSLGKSFLRYRIIAGTTPRMTPENAPDSQIKSFEGSVFLDGFDRISRAGRRKPTRGRSKGRNTCPVKIDGNQ